MNIWDWHYRFFFDRELRCKVLDWIRRLPRVEAEVCRETLSFYSSFYTFGILIDQIDETPERCSEFLDAALSRSSDILCTPALLREHYEKRIENSAVLPAQKEALRGLLRLSASGRDIHEEYWRYAESVLGGLYDGIFCEIMRDKYADCVRIPRQKRIVGNYVDLFETCYHEIVGNPSLIDRFGNCRIGDFRIDVREGVAYGEWWDRDLTVEAEDRLILFTHDSAVKYDDYYYTILHETYPGHGHFYESVRNRQRDIDHGATLLIEGWATFCEWHACPSPYIEAIRHNAVSFLRNAKSHTPDETANWLRDTKKRQKIPHDRIIQSIINATQYIGFSESYYLGALWLEEILLRQGRYTPKQFLDMLNRCDKGDYFRLWA